LETEQDDAKPVAFGRDPWLGKQANATAASKMPSALAGNQRAAACCRAPGCRFQLRMTPGRKVRSIAVAVFVATCRRLLSTELQPRGV
jgi:hypothetical protein